MVDGATQLAEERSTAAGLSTYCASFDRLLGGAVRCGEVTEICAPPTLASSHAAMRGVGACVLVCSVFDPLCGCCDGAGSVHVFATLRAPVQVAFLGAARHSSGALTALARGPCKAATLRCCHACSSALRQARPVALLWPPSGQSTGTCRGLRHGRMWRSNQRHTRARSPCRLQLAAVAQLPRPWGGLGGGSVVLGACHRVHLHNTLARGCSQLHPHGLRC